jgi:hypothetical protein
MFNAMQPTLRNTIEEAVSALVQEISRFLRDRALGVQMDERGMGRFDQVSMIKLRKQNAALGRCSADPSANWAPTRKTSRPCSPGSAYPASDIRWYSCDERWGHGRWYTITYDPATQKRWHVLAGSTIASQFFDMHPEEFLCRLGNHVAPRSNSACCSWHTRRPSLQFPPPFNNVSIFVAGAPVLVPDCKKTDVSVCRICRLSCQSSSFFATCCR